MRDLDAKEFVYLGDSVYYNTKYDYICTRNGSWAENVIYLSDIDTELLKKLLPKRSW